jgi:Cof subfamily protein (haloacid dehalogenase superfamily)
MTVDGFVVSLNGSEFRGGDRCRFAPTDGAKVNPVLPRAIAFDLDGTLCRNDGRPSPESMATLRRCAEAGIVLVVATGRPMEMVTPILNGNDRLFTGAVVANGAIVLDLTAGTVVDTAFFDFDDAAAIVERLQAVDQTLGFAIATDRGFFAEHGFVARTPAGTGPEVDNALAASRAAGSRHTHKLMVFSPTDDVHVLLNRLPPLMPDGIRISHLGIDAAEIGPAAISKGAGLAIWCRYAGIDPSDVWAFGDNLNDHEMFDVVGHAIAPSSADFATRSHADEICGPNDDDGVAQRLEELLATGR